MRLIVIDEIHGPSRSSCGNSECRGPVLDVCPTDDFDDGDTDLGGFRRHAEFEDRVDEHKRD